MISPKSQQILLLIWKYISRYVQCQKVWQLFIQFVIRKLLKLKSRQSAGEERLLGWPRLAASWELLEISNSWVTESQMEIKIFYLETLTSNSVRTLSCRGSHWWTLTSLSFLTVPESYWRCINLTARVSELYSLCLGGQSDLTTWVVGSKSEHLVFDYLWRHCQLIKRWDVKNYPEKMFS